VNFKGHLQEQLQDPEFRREWKLHEECYQDVKRVTKWLIHTRVQRDRARAKVKNLEARLEALEGRLEALENKGTYICPHCKNRVKNTGLIGGGCPSCGKRSYDPVYEDNTHEVIDGLKEALKEPWNYFKERPSWL